MKGNSMQSVLKITVALLISGLFSSAAVAVNLWFSADYLAAKLGDQCGYEFTTPVMMPRTLDDERIVALVEQFNADQREKRDALIQDMREFFDAGYCNGFQLREFRGSDFTVTTPMYSNSVLVTHYRDHGGNHGFSTQQAYTFDLTTAFIGAKQIESLADIFAKESFPLVLQLIDKKLHQTPRFDASFGWDKLKQQWMALSNITNFYLTDRGVVVYFEEYEVGPYSDGIIEVIIYWSEALNEVGLTWTGEKMAKSLMTDDRFY